MKMTYIPRIKGNMRGYKTIHTSKTTSRIIDGSYNSIYKGRSMNFDELREYVPGDDIKDVDWKASARSQKMLVREYIAEKKHNIMLVMDTSKRMRANANDIQEKYDVAILAAGTLAYMVSENGDYVSATYMAENGVRHYPFKTGLMNVENILAGYHRAVMEGDRTSIVQALKFVAKSFRRRMIIVIVTDSNGVMELPDTVVRQLKVLHDVILINIDDAGVMGRSVFDIDDGVYIPDFFTADGKLEKIEEDYRKKLRSRCDNKLKKMGVSYSVMGTSDGMDEQIVALLEKHRTQSLVR